MQQVLSHCVLVVWSSGCLCAKVGRAGEPRPEWGAACGDRPLVTRASDGSRCFNLGRLCRFGGVFCG